MMLARSASEALAITSAAVGPSWPIRMSSGPSRRNEKPRSASSSCIEDTPDIHHDAIDRVDALRGANLGEIGKPVLDQRQPAGRSVDQIEPAGDGRPVAVDADDAGPAGSRMVRL